VRQGKPRTFTRRQGGRAVALESPLLAAGQALHQYDVGVFPDSVILEGFPAFKNLPLKYEALARLGHGALRHEPRFEGVNLELFCGGTWRKAAGVAKEA
jgi:hypothetical protein